MEPVKQTHIPLLDHQAHNHVHPQLNAVHPTHPQYMHYPQNGQDGHVLPNPVGYGGNVHYNGVSVSIPNPDHQALISKCQELEQKIRSYDFIMTLHFVYHALGIALYVLLILLLLSIMIFTDACFGHNFCLTGFYGWLIFGVLALILLVIILTHGYGFKVYFYKQEEKMGTTVILYSVSMGIFIVFSLLWGFKVLVFPVIAGVLGYFAYTAYKISSLYEELTRTKTQLAPQTGGSSVAY